MNMNTHTPPPHSFTLAWEKVHSILDKESQIRIDIHRARQERKFSLYSIALGIANNDRVKPFVQIRYDVASMLPTNVEAIKHVHNYAAIITRLAVEALAWITECQQAEKAERQEQLYNRDQTRASKAQPPQSTRIGSNGKTAREREKRKTKSA